MIGPQLWILHLHWCVHTCAVSDIDFSQQGNEVDHYLSQLALKLVQGKPNESVGYGVVNEMLTHRASESLPTR